jgi:hypothetical protein
LKQTRHGGKPAINRFSYGTRHFASQFWGSWVRIFSLLQLEIMQSLLNLNSSTAWQVYS